MPQETSALPNRLAHVFAMGIVALEPVLVAAEPIARAASARTVLKEWPLPRSQQAAPFGPHPPRGVAGRPKRIRLDPVPVAFHRNWESNSGQHDPSRRLTRDDRGASKTELASEFRKVFGGTPDKSDCPLVEEDDGDVLRVMASIPDLYVTAPDTMSVGRSRGHVQDTGHLMLGLELRNSVTSQPLVRAVRQASATSMRGRYQVSDGIAIPVDARRAISMWMDVLCTVPDQVSGIPGTE